MVWGGLSKREFSKSIQYVLVEDASFSLPRLKSIFVSPLML